jgi:hypothetical protein
MLIFNAGLDFTYAQVVYTFPYIFIVYCTATLIYVDYVH